jgi:O-antigen/teichoic acid export membrane protein
MTLRRILSGLGLIGISGTIAAVCGAISLGLNARGLGPNDFGVLATIQGYTALISAVATFESWQPVVRLGIRLPRQLGRTLSSGIMLDVLAAALAGSVATASIFLFGSAFGITPEHQNLAIIYCLSLLFGWAGTPKGYFRLLGRYDVLAGYQAALALAVLVASFALFTVQASLVHYIVAFACIGAIYNVLLFIRMLASLRSASIALRNPLGSRRGRFFLRTFLGMASGSSANSTLTATRPHIALLLVASFLGPEQAGLYSIAARLVSIISKLGHMLNQVLFPEIIASAASLEAERLSRLVNETAFYALIVMGTVAGVGALASQFAIAAAAGPEFMDAAPVLVILLAAECVIFAGIHLNPIIQSRAGTMPLLWINLAALLSLLAGALVLLGPFGTLGMALPVLFAAIAGWLATYVTARRLIQKHQTRGG